MIRIGILGNCQAMPIQAWLRTMPALDVPYVPLNYEITQAQEAEVCGMLDSCDFVFYQRMGENYPIAFLRTSAIKAHYNLAQRLFRWLFSGPALPSR
jgi:hypothetical protein